MKEFGKKRKISKKNPIFFKRQHLMVASLVGARLLFLSCVLPPSGRHSKGLEQQKTIKKWIWNYVDYRSMTWTHTSHQERPFWDETQQASEMLWNMWNCEVTRLRPWPLWQLIFFFFSHLFFFSFWKGAKTGRQLRLWVAGLAIFAKNTLMNLKTEIFWKD